MFDHPLLLLIALIVLMTMSAFFSGSETALMALSRLSIQRLKETRPRRAGMIETLLDKPEKLIGTILLGNNLVNVIMSVLATILALSLWGEQGIVYVTVVLTLSILIFAEIIPKVYAKYFDERVSMFAAPVLKVVMTAFNPVVVAITYASTRILALLGVDVTKVEAPLFTEAEVRDCIKLAWAGGGITANERSILSRVFTLNDRLVSDIMIPRERMAVINVDASVEEVRAVILKTGYTRFPVSRGETREIIGFLHAKDVLNLSDEKDQGGIATILRPPYFIPESRTIDFQLRYFQAKRLHQAVVIDSGNSPVGLITLEDILEELVGDIQDEHDFVAA